MNMTTHNTVYLLLTDTNTGFDIYDDLKLVKETIEMYGGFYKAIQLEPDEYEAAVAQIIANETQLAFEVKEAIEKGEE